MEGFLTKKQKQELCLELRLEKNRKYADRIRTSKPSDYLTKEGVFQQFVLTTTNYCNISSIFPKRIFLIKSFKRSN